MKSRLAGTLCALLALASGDCDKNRGSSRDTKTRHARPVPPGPRRPARPGPDPAQTIPTPPLRMDAHVYPEELALLPEDAPLVLAGRPDLLDRLFMPGGWIAHHLRGVPAYARLAAALTGASPSKALGLNTSRYFVASLLHAPAAERKTLEQAMDQLSRQPGRPEAKQPVWPPLRLRCRLVAAVSDPARARATLAALPQGAALLGAPGLHAADASILPKPLGALARQGAVLIRFEEKDGLALAISIVGSHLVVDLALSVAGPFDAATVTQLLSQPARPPHGAASSSPGAGQTATESVSPLTDPFGRLALLSGADLTLLVRAEALAEGALWLGMRQALISLRDARPDMQAELHRLAFRIARIPRTFAQTLPRPFDRFALHLHLTGREPLLTLSWRMTPAGQRLLEGIAPKLVGRDLGVGRRFVDDFLRPLAGAVAKDLPPVEPWMDAGLMGRLAEGGSLTWAVVAASHWPRLLAMRAARKVLLRLARERVRPGRFVKRVNLDRRGDVLQLRLEGRPVSAARAGASPLR